MKARFEPSGDAAVVVIVAEAPSVEATTRIAVVEHDLSNAVDLDVVPALTSLLVTFDPLVTAYVDVVRRVEQALRATASTPAMPVREWVLPIAYGGSLGPDLDELADGLGVGSDAAADAHAAHELSCLAVGFAPGFVYAGMLDVGWDIPRRNQIHPTVPPGSVSVALRQTTITSTTTPTGWSVIGRTAVRNFDPTTTEVTAIRAGHVVLFERVSESDVARLSELMADGRWAPRWTDR